MKTKPTKAAKRRAKALKVKPLFECKRVGGLTFVRLGPIVLSFCISR